MNALKCRIELLIFLVNSMSLVKGAVNVNRQLLKCCNQCIASPSCQRVMYSTVNNTCVLQGDTLAPALFSGFKTYSLMQIEKTEELMLHIRAGYFKIQIGNGNDKDSICITNETISSLKTPGCSPEKVKIFFEACKEGNLTEVKRLVWGGIASVTCQNGTRSTALMVASWNKQNDIVDFLLQEKSDLSAIDNTLNHALHYACSIGSTYIVKTLLDKSESDMDLRNKKWQTPLICAVVGVHLPVVKLLKVRGADFGVVDRQKYNILHLACIGGNVEMVKYLLSLDIIDIERRGGRNNRTPLLVAVFEGHVPVVRLLKTKGADLKAVDKNRYNILHVACAVGNVKMVTYVISLNVTNIEALEYRRRSPLMVAVKMGRLPIVKLLHDQYRARITGSDYEGSNVLHIACEKGYKIMVEYLSTLRELKGFQWKNNGRAVNCIRLAQRNGYTSIANIFLKPKG